MTETLFHIEFIADLPRWGGVPLAIIGGKGLRESRSDIVIKFRKEVQLHGKKMHELVIPTSGFDIRAKISAKPKNIREAYERVFLGALKKDRRYFASLEEAVQGWKFVEAIEKKWKKSILMSYYPLRSDMDF